MSSAFTVQVRSLKRSLPIAAIGLALTVLALATPLQAGDWTKITEPLISSIPAYDASIPGARGVGGVVVDRTTGDLYVALNGEPFGVYRSSDGGKTWTCFDDGTNVAGGWVRSAAISIDQNRAGRIAFFRAFPPGPRKNERNRTSRSAMTLDGGKTWSVFDNPFALQGFGGWTFGTVDWSVQDARDVIAQGRIRPKISISRDKGKTWDSLGRISVIDDTFNVEYIRAKDPGKWENWKEKRVKGFGVHGGAVLLGRYDGIERSTDGGENFQKVSDFIVSTYVPVFFDGKLYWGTETGLIVSEDGGESWAMLGAELPNIVKGPFFGADATKMVVVTADGVYKTASAGETWSKISDLLKDEDAWRADVKPLHLRHDYAWDYTRDVIYAAGLAGSLYKKEVE
jgi:hypothetical protein